MIATVPGKSIPNGAKSMTLVSLRAPYAARSFLRIGFLWLILSIAGATCCFADEPAQGDEAEKREEAEKKDIQTLVDIVADVEIITGDDGVPLDFNKTPVLKWPNVSRNTLLGGTFIWTREGRPEVIACLWDWNERGMWFGIQSLTTNKVIARKGNTTFWRSEKPDLEFKKLGGAAAPADSPVRRLSQMKEFANRFRARLHTKNDKDTEELRLLTTPIYRYKSGDIIDGALFAFVQGTDPEVMLHLEAQTQKGAKGEVTQWRYAISRRTVMPVEAMLDDKQIWAAEFSWGGPDQPFYQSSFP